MYGLKADEAGLAIICDFSQEPVGSVLVAILNLLDLMGLARSAPCLSETPTKCSRQVWTILVSKNLFQQINIVLQGRYYFLLYFLKSRARLLKVAHQTLLNNLSLRLGGRVIKFLPLNVNFSSWQILLTSYFYSYFSYPNWHLIMLISKYFLNICLPSLLSLW